MYNNLKNILEFRFFNLQNFLQIVRNVVQSCKNRSFRTIMTEQEAKARKKIDRFSTERFL